MQAVAKSLLGYEKSSLVKIDSKNEIKEKLLENISFNWAAQQTTIKYENRMCTLNNNIIDLNNENSTLRANIFFIFFLNNSFYL